MIIACPACTTRYVVPDNAIGIDGRTVRCAKCRHSWFQEGPRVDEARADESSEPDRVDPAKPANEPHPNEIRVRPRVDDPAESSAAAATASDATSEERDVLPPVAARVDDARYEDDVERAEEDVPASDTVAAPAAEISVPEPSPHRDPDPVDEVDAAAIPDYPAYEYDEAEAPRPRRNRLRMFTWAAALFALLAVSAIVAIQVAGLPSWTPFGPAMFAVEQPGLEIDFPEDMQERRQQPDGTRYFAVRGSVTNTTRETLEVPPILILLRDERDTVVYNLEVMPAQDRLGPGERIEITEAITDIPQSARFAEFGWAMR